MAPLGLTLLLLCSGASAQTADTLTPVTTPPATAEPITPIPTPPPTDPLKVALGERLFADPRLSVDGRRACTSCHEVNTSGADANPRDMARDGSLLKFNTSSVFNAALNFRLNWKGDARTLEEQADVSLMNPDVMGDSVDKALARLKADPGVTQQFDDIYGHGPDHTALLDAIATYERSLLTPGSRFDRWLGGDSTAITAEEYHGYQLFKSLGCISCHQGVNVGGNIYERSGIYHPVTDTRHSLLRVPSLRNVAVTAPYFHDGSVPTLNEAIRRMAKAQVDQVLPSAETDAIAAFLQTLTGLHQGHLLTAPKHD
jgi:cytochrome c peroxidase